MKNCTSRGLCACLGPMFNEPCCSCEMVAKGLTRSKEWEEYHSPENQNLRREKLDRIFRGEKSGSSNLE